MMGARAGFPFGAVMPAHPPFAVWVERRRRVPLVSVSGDLDLATSPQLSEILATVMRDPGVDRIALDLSQVSFIDCAGFRPISWCRDELRGREGDLLIRRASPAVLRLLRLLDWEGLVSV